MKIDTMRFQGIHPDMIPSIIAFFESARACSTIFKSCATQKDGKVMRSQDEARSCHREMEMTVVFAGIAKCELNTQFMTFTLEIRIIQEMEIIDWQMTECGKRAGYADSDGSRTMKIGCPKDIIDQIHRLLGIYGESEVMR